MMREFLKKHQLNVFVHLKYFLSNNHRLLVDFLFMLIQNPELRYQRFYDLNNNLLIHLPSFFNKFMLLLKLANILYF